MWQRDISSGFQRADSAGYSQVDSAARLAATPVVLGDVFIAEMAARARDKGSSNALAVA